MKQKTLLVASGILCLNLSSPADLVAHYKFDEAAGATIAADDLGNVPGVIGESVITGLPGIAGNAYQFEGFPFQDNIVDMGNAAFFPAIVASGQLSFSAWINTTDTNGNRNTVVFAGSDTSSSIYADLGVTNDGWNADPPTPLGEASARNRPSGAAGVQQTGIFSTGIKVNNGTWHHLVMTVNPSAADHHLRLYVDGVQANSQTMTTLALPAFNNFEIGRLGRSSPADGFEGLIDDVQVYSRALTLEEVQFLFANPGVPVSPPSAELAITSSAIDGTNFRIFFTGAPSRNYHVRASLDLLNFDINEGTAATDGNGEGSATIPLVPGRARQFYRIEEVPAP